MLDPKGRERVMRTVRMLNEEKGITIVLITHFMEEAAMAKRVVALSHGKIAKAIRTVVKAAATKANAKVVVEIVQ